MLTAGGSGEVHDVLDRFYDAVQDRDLGRTAAVLDPAVVWDVPAPVPDRGRLHGKAAVLEWLDRPLPGAYCLQRTDLRIRAARAAQVRGLHIWTTEHGSVDLRFIHEISVQGGLVIYLREQLPDGLLRAHAALRSVEPTTDRP